MKATFEKQSFNENIDYKADYIEMFNKMGFNPSNVQVCLTNGLSAYITLNVKVLNENKMYAETFVYNGIATITVRVSDHASGLEKNCGGVCNNQLSFNAFKHLVDNSIITNN